MPWNLSGFMNLQRPIFGPRFDLVTSSMLLDLPGPMTPTCLDVAFPWPHVLATDVPFARTPWKLPRLEMLPLGRHFRVPIYIYIWGFSPGGHQARDHVARRQTMALWRGRYVRPSEDNRGVTTYNRRVRSRSWPRSRRRRLRRG
jgi:hypothetical protein